LRTGEFCEAMIAPQHMAERLAPLAGSAGSLPDPTLGAP
jgi:hypothetical protein